MYFSQSSFSPYLCEINFCRVYFWWNASSSLMSHILLFQTLFPASVLDKKNLIYYSHQSSFFSSFICKYPLIVNRQFISYEFHRNIFYRAPLRRTKEKTNKKCQFFAVAQSRDDLLNNERIYKNKVTLSAPDAVPKSTVNKIYFRPEKRRKIDWWQK